MTEPKKIPMTIYDLIGFETDPLEVYDFHYMSIQMASQAIVLSGIADVHEDFYCFAIPFALDWTYDDDGSPTGFTFVKFIPGSDEFFYLVRKDAVVSMGLMSTEYEESYEKATDTFIESMNQKYSKVEEVKQEGENVVAFKKKTTTTVH